VPVLFLLALRLLFTSALFVATGAFTNLAFPQITLFNQGRAILVHEARLLDGIRSWTAGRTGRLRT